jgi:hypothetical protein
LFLKISFCLEEKFKVNTSLPVRKKAKNERGTIISFFNNKKSDSKEETRRPLKSTRRNKKEPQSISSDIHLGSSVQVEKTSLILFDEVGH